VSASPLNDSGLGELTAIVGGRVAATDQRPFLIAVTGGVAAGKSTVADTLRSRLSHRWSVAVVSTDGFLFPNAELDRRGLAARKGFPETYDLDRLARVLDDIRAGRDARIPAYSHVTYDIVPGEEQAVDPADVGIVEGLPVLQPGLVDHFDLSIYVDAAEADLERWYVERFLALREAARNDEKSFFHGFVPLSEDETTAIAHEVWHRVNGPNTREHVVPTREGADVIVEKAADHSVRSVRERQDPAG
jgi:type I pantothenate kinase